MYVISRGKAAALAAILGTAGCGGVTHPVFDPSGRASAWTQGVLGASPDMTLAVRLPEPGEPFPLRDVSGKLLDGATLGRRIDFFATFDGAGVHAWCAAAPEAPAQTFDSLARDAKGGWTAPRDLGSGVRESCTTQDQPQRCMFGFPGHGLVATDIGSADRASRIFARSADPPVPLTVPNGVFIAGWSDAAASAALDATTG